MQHQDWQDLIPFYIAQTLPADQVRQFEAHLATCKTCQAEIDNWRMIASAVWRDADEAAQQLPPLSADVYNRLNYREGVPRSRYSSNPPSAQSVMPSQKIRQLPVRSVPLTLIAGIVVAVMFGGLLFFFAFRPTSDNGEVILMDSTASTDSTSDMASSMMNDDNITVTATPIGIIPTQSQNPTSGAPTFSTPTPNLGESLPLPLSTIDSAVAAIGGGQSDSPIPLGDGPYITLTPLMLSADDGLFLCEAFNPTSRNIQVYTQPQDMSPIIGIIANNQRYRVREQSPEGWYLVEIGDVSGWIPPENAFLIGSCIDFDQTPIPTQAVTVVATEEVISTQQLELPSTESVIVVNASYADIHIAPNFNSEVIAVATRGEEFVLVGYQGIGVERWAMIVSGDGQQAWIWASVITENSLEDAP